MKVSGFSKKRGASGIGETAGNTFGFATAADFLTVVFFVVFDPSLRPALRNSVLLSIAVEDPFAVDVVEVVVFVSPFVDIAVKHAHRLADFGDIGVVIGDDIDNALLIVRQRQHLVAVEGDVEIGRPAEVFRIEILLLNPYPNEYHHKHSSYYLRVHPILQL